MSERFKLAEKSSGLGGDILKCPSHLQTNSWSELVTTCSGNSECRRQKDADAPYVPTFEMFPHEKHDEALHMIREEGQSSNQSLHVEQLIQ